jgi:hypothetical protein
MEKQGVLMGRTVGGPAKLREVGNASTRAATRYFSQEVTVSGGKAIREQ